MRRRAQGTTVALSVLLVAAGCGSGDDDASPTTRPATTTSTQAPASDAHRVQRYVENLLFRYDRAVNQLTTHPAVASDSDGPAAKGYRSLFEPGNKDVDRALAAWAADAASGERYAPAADGSAINRSKLDGDLTVVSADRVTFPTCDIQSYRHYDRGGKLVDSAEHRLSPGTGTAVRVDGRWYLHELDAADNAVGCATESETP